MPSAPAASSPRSSSSQAASSRADDERCHPGSASTASPLSRLASLSRPSSTFARAAAQDAEKP